MSFLVSLLVLSFLIFFHELGHFLAARFFKVKVEVFSIGFGKKILTKRWGETDYCLSAIPLGGYVQMKGQDDSNPLNTSKDEDGYGGKPPWQRIIILFAGPFANFLLAFLLYVAIGHLGTVKRAPQVGSVNKDSAAFHAGLDVNDTILSINDEKIDWWSDIGPVVVNSKGSLTLKIKRGDQIISKTLTPKIGKNKNIFGEEVKEKLIGISWSGKVETFYYKGLNSLSFALKETIFATNLILLGLEKLIQGVVSPKEMGGIISIVKYTSDAVNMGIVVLFTITAIISVNLGLLNLFPIPALDGGHIMFTVYEMIFRKPPSEKVYLRLTYVGWAFLLTLMAFTIINDILRLMGVY